jgi:hypothetical protein
VESAFLLHPAQLSVQFNLPAERQPFVELAMVDEQNLFVVNGKNHDSEINFSRMCAMGRGEFKGGL